MLRGWQKRRKGYILKRIEGSFARSSIDPGSQTVLRLLLNTRLSSRCSWAFFSSSLRLRLPPTIAGHALSWAVS